WTSPRFVQDNSARQCKTAANTAACSTLGGATGVGVMDQGPLFHFQLESAPLDNATLACGTFAPVGGAVNFPQTSLPPITVPPKTCVQMRTIFGRTPSAVQDKTPCDATTCPALALANWNLSSRGQLGDIGYSVVSKVTKVGGPLVSQKALLTVATKNKNVVAI